MRQFKAHAGQEKEEAAETGLQGDPRDSNEIPLEVVHLLASLDFRGVPAGCDLQTSVAVGEFPWPVLRSAVLGRRSGCLTVSLSPEAVNRRQDEEMVACNYKR